MAASLSPDHVFNFLEDDPTHNIEEFKEEPEEEPKEEPKEEPEEEAEERPKEVIGVTHWMPLSGSTFEVGGPSTASSLPPHLLGRKVKRLREDIKILFSGMMFGARDATRTNDKVLALKDDGRRLRWRLDSLEASHTLMAMNRERLEREFYSMWVWMAERIGWGSTEARPSHSINVLAVYETTQLLEPRGPSDGSQ
ncbi:hypothetical protein Tco_1026820 [Tanacetum coccineum]